MKVKFFCWTKWLRTNPPPINHPQEKHDWQDLQKNSTKSKLEFVKCSFDCLANKSKKNIFFFKERHLALVAFCYERKWQSNLLLDSNFFLCPVFIKKNNIFYLLSYIFFSCLSSNIYIKTLFSILVFLLHLYFYVYIKPSHFINS